MRYAALPTHLSSEAKLHAPSTGSKAVTTTLAALALAIASLTLPATAQTGGAYKVTNLISDGSVPAVTTDANFINPWGMSASPTWWISAQATGFSYVAQATGVIPFKVIVPAASGLPTATGLPAGCISTGALTGFLLPNGTKASFLFSTLDGTISGWNSKLGTANAISQIVINNSAAKATYTDLALITNTTGSYILAANFGQGNAIEVYDSTFKLATLTGAFTDPTLPATYSPYSVHAIGTQVFVTYGVRTTTTPFRTVDAPGNGIVSVFDTSGKFIARAVTGGNLNSPWGVAFAPASFGIFSNDLLIGNFGDGLINVYDPKTYAYLGQLIDGTGKPLTYASLWELLPGNTPISGGDPSTVYFTAGLAGEAHGLLAGISNDPAPTGTPTYGFSASTASANVTAGSSTQATISAAPTNNFSGTVTLTCSGLPTGATCTFAPAQLTVSATTSAVSTLTIQTSKASASLQRKRLGGASPAGITSALLLPFASLLVFRRRFTAIAVHPFRLLGLAIFLIASTGFVLGCGGSSNPTTPSTPGTPTGQSKITIAATSGAITQQTSLTLTVQ
ncbi:TIGR03118 family protein [Granulicella sp. dw_53]|uniref:TIGR03118 family protein n=1 Tax=Granulicella sp. dw_53 TaxID=2719792 RepID=UPI001BD4878C|nr:TIGR03118 family protein [Granulicella sp. dw_53]